MSQINPAHTFPSYFAKIHFSIVLSLTAHFSKRLVSFKHFPATALYVYVAREGSVCIATRYGLDGLGIESQVDAAFSASVQTGLGAHPTSCTMGDHLTGGKAAGAWR